MAQPVAYKGWWPLCGSEELTDRKPVGVQCGDTRIAIYRDSDNRPRALEDRCPHRRVPLSLGRVTPDGFLQCGYHGWTFDGDNGDLIRIPNLSEGERVPQCAIRCYATTESNGLVYVCLGEESENPGAEAILEQPYRPGAREFRGVEHVPVSHEEFVAALMDGPDLVFGFTGVLFGERPLGDPRFDDGLLTLDRIAYWNWGGIGHANLGPLRHRADNPLMLRTRTEPVTGTTTAQVCDNEGHVLAQSLLACAPAARGTTAVRWRASVVAGSGVPSGKGPALLRALTRLGKSPFKVNSMIDGEALAALLPGPSDTWRQASRDSTPLSLSETA